LPPELPRVVRTLAWRGDALELLDQRRLPLEAPPLLCRSVEDVREAIRTLAVRGAPAIGVAAGYGLAIAARESSAADWPGLERDLETAAGRLRSSRPTAVNLGWALDRVLAAARAVAPGGPKEVRAAVLAEAEAIDADDRARCEAIGRAGLDLVPDGARVLTHCNAGALATAGIGTALAPVYAAHAAGREVAVLADETRPLLQGARITAWELAESGVPVTVICDGMAGYAMQRGKIDLVLVGADRIAANGDFANKIGTYAVAVLAREHGLPFYVAAPLSTFDANAPDGAAIPIEERDADEVRASRGVPFAPPDADVWNPAFDVTPARFVTAFVTDAGVLRPPFGESIAAALGA